MLSGCVALLWLPGLAITWAWSYIRTYLHTAMKAKSSHAMWTLHTCYLIGIHKTL